MVYDIRKSPDDRQIPGSIRLESAELEAAAEPPFDTGEEVVLYCGSGNSCSRLAEALCDRGYRVRALQGGYRAWTEAGFPTEER